VARSLVPIQKQWQYHSLTNPWCIQRFHAGCIFYALEGEKILKQKILVTYASRFGSTEGVAQAIGKTLSEAGADVDVLPMSGVKDLSIYKSIVAGSAINGGAWLPEAMQFMRDHVVELERKPFAAFLVCMTLTMKNGGQYRSHVVTWLDPVRALVKPVSTGLFAGGLDISKIPAFSDRLKFRLSVLFGVWKEGDHRDWNAIRQWAQEIAPLLIH
jgi:menaquinone-dependent protoporphyrinogen oxidase